ncbi:MAG: molybdenum cofactor guanylyltransferase [Alphaproteobacteria bacterium]|nr:molybdenum cofactor guanylyltransferase [Alphaproteobacteria bacterium]
MSGDVIPAVILVGGAGRRMGGVDKPMMPLAGRPLLSYVIDILAPQTPHIALATRADPEPYRSFGLPLLPDPVADQGPLTGLRSALEWAKTTVPNASHVALLAGDTPFIPSDLFTRLGAMRSPSPSCVFAVSNGQTHYSIGLWPLTAHALLEAFEGTNSDRSLRGFAHDIGFKTVEWTDEHDPFFNINAPDDLAEAALRVKRIKSA